MKAYWSTVGLDISMWLVFYKVGKLGHRHTHRGGGCMKTGANDRKAKEQPEARRDLKQILPCTLEAA